MSAESPVKEIAKGEDSDYGVTTTEHVLVDNTVEPYGPSGKTISNLSCEISHSYRLYATRVPRSLLLSLCCHVRCLLSYRRSPLRIRSRCHQRNPRHGSLPQSIPRRIRPRIRCRLQEGSYDGYDHPRCLHWCSQSGLDRRLGIPKAIDHDICCYLHSWLCYSDFCSQL